MSLVDFSIIGGGMVPLQVQMLSNASVLDMKETIREILDVPVARQTLKYCDIELLDDEILQVRFGNYDAVTLMRLPGGDYEAPGVAAGNLRVKYKIKLYMSPLSGDPKFSISVVRSPGTDATTIRVRETYTVTELKEKIQRRLGIFSDRLILFRFNGLIMEDNVNSLAEYFVCEGCSIRVVVEMEGN